MKWRSITVLCTYTSSVGRAATELGKAEVTLKEKTKAGKVYRKLTTLLRTAVFRSILNDLRS